MLFHVCNFHAINMRHNFPAESRSSSLIISLLLLSPSQTLIWKSCVYILAKSKVLIYIRSHFVSNILSNQKSKLCNMTFFFNAIGGLFSTSSIFLILIKLQEWGLVDSTCYIIPVFWKLTWHGEIKNRLAGNHRVEVFLWVSQWATPLIFEIRWII